MRSSFVQTRDLRTHYLQAGTGDPVVLIHGFPQTNYEWRHQISALSERFAVFAPDNRGFGQTDKPGVRVSRGLLAEDVINFMDALGIERATIVGHDWGGFIAFKTAIDHPDRVSRLALLDTFCTTWAATAVHGFWFKSRPLPEEYFAQNHRQFIEGMFGGAEDVSQPGRPASPWKFGSALGRWASPDDIEHYARAFADPAAHESAISYYRNALPFHRITPDPSAAHGERFRLLEVQEVAEMWLHEGGLEAHPLFGETFDFGPEDRHKRFSAPTLWMMGRFFGGAGPTGPVLPPSGTPTLDQFTRYFPDLRAYRMNAGHFFPEELPEVTTAALLQFLSSPSAAASG